MQPTRQLNSAERFFWSQASKPYASGQVILIEGRGAARIVCI